MHDDVRECTRQQVESHAETPTTLARLETLLVRMVRHADNSNET